MDRREKMEVGIEVLDMDVAGDIKSAEEGEVTATSTSSAPERFACPLVPSQGGKQGTAQTLQEKKSANYRLFVFHPRSLRRSSGPTHITGRSHNLIFRDGFLDTSQSRHCDAWG